MQLDQVLSFKEEMRDWANSYGRAVPQHSVRQKTTMHTCGKPPLSMYENVPEMTNDVLTFPGFHQENINGDQHEEEIPVEDNVEYEQIDEQSQ